MHFSATGVAFFWTKETTSITLWKSADPRTAPWTQVVSVTTVAWEGNDTNTFTANNNTYVIYRRQGDEIHLLGLDMAIDSIMENSLFYTLDTTNSTLEGGANNLFVHDEYAIVGRITATANGVGNNVYFTRKHLPTSDVLTTSALPSVGYGVDVMSFVYDDALDKIMATITYDTAPFAGVKPKRKTVIPLTVATLAQGTTAAAQNLVGSNQLEFASVSPVARVGSDFWYEWINRTDTDLLFNVGTVNESNVKGLLLYTMRRVGSSYVVDSAVGTLISPEQPQAGSVKLFADKGRLLNLTYLAGNELKHRYRNGMTSFTLSTDLLSGLVGQYGLTLLERDGREYMGITYALSATGIYYEEIALSNPIWIGIPGIVNETKWGLQDIHEVPGLAIEPIASLEVVNNPLLRLSNKMPVAGIIGREAFGSSRLQSLVQASGIYQPSSWGSFKTARTLPVESLVNLNAVGVAAVSRTIQTVGISERTAYGQPSLNQQVKTVGILSGTGAIPSPKLDTYREIIAQGIGRVSFVNPVQVNQEVHAVGWESSAVGQGLIGGFLNAESIDAPEMPAPVVIYDQNIHVSTSINEGVVGVPERILFGTTMPGIPSVEAHGQSRVRREVYAVTTESIMSRELFGQGQLLQTIYLQAVNDGTAPQNVKVRAINQLRPIGITSQQFIGAIQVSQLIRPTSINSQESVEAPESMKGVIRSLGIPPGEMGRPQIRNDVIDRPLLTLGVIL